MHKLGGIDYQNLRFRRGRPVYLHDVHEAIQFVQLVRREIDMPDEFRPFAYERGLRVDRGMIKALGQAECVVVESCTDKHYEAAGWTLNVNEVYRRIVEGAGEAGQDWWAIVDCCERPSEALIRRVEEQLRARWRTRWQLGEGHRLVLRELTFRYLSAAEIAEGLKLLQALLARPLLVVTHVVVRLADGTHLAERLQHVVKTLEAANEIGQAALDPRTFVERDSQCRALANGGADFNHYATDYVHVVGREIVEALRDNFQL